MAAAPESSRRDTRRRCRAEHRRSKQRVKAATVRCQAKREGIRKMRRRDWISGRSRRAVKHGANALSQVDRAVRLAQQLEAAVGPFLLDQARGVARGEEHPELWPALERRPGEIR